MIELYHELEKYTDAACLQLILQEHPEVQILWNCRKNLQKPAVVNGEDPLLHLLYEAIVEKQIQAEDPPQVGQTLERLLGLGLSRPAARGAIVKLFRWYMDPANQKSDVITRAGTNSYLQKLNFLGQEPGKIGRNQLCPCLSGQKFKKCCLPLSKQLEIGPADGELFLGAGAYFNPYFQDREAYAVYAEMDNRSYLSRYLEKNGDLENALLYLQENVRTVENRPVEFQENALKELLYFCTQHSEYAALGLDAAERIMNLPGVDRAEFYRCRCDQADLLAALHGLNRGIAEYQLLEQELPNYDYADFRRADLLQRFGQTETAQALLKEIEARREPVPPEVQILVSELLRKIRSLQPAGPGDGNG